jgi:hypothetical protein
VSAILTIGCHRFALTSAAVAAAIAEALREAPQVEIVPDHTRPRVRFEPALDASRILTFRVDAAGPEDLSKVPPLNAHSPFVQAVLGEPAKSRRRTITVLNTPCCGKTRSLIQ